MSNNLAVQGEGSFIAYNEATQKIDITFYMDYQPQGNRLPDLQATADVGSASDMDADGGSVSLFCWMSPKTSLIHFVSRLYP